MERVKRRPVVGDWQMHPLEQTVGVVGPIVGAIVFLTVFFKFVGWFSRPRQMTRIQLDHILTKKTPVTLNLDDGTKLEDVFLLGVNEDDSQSCLFYFGQ
jgi:hypothetical protein